MKVGVRPQSGQFQPLEALGNLIGGLIGRRLGQPTEPPKLAKARDSPLWEMQSAELGEIDLVAQAEPEYAFDQRVTW